MERAKLCFATSQKEAFSIYFRILITQCGTPAMHVIAVNMFPLFKTLTVDITNNHTNDDNTSFQLCTDGGKGLINLFYVSHLKGYKMHHMLHR